MATTDIINDMNFTDLGCLGVMRILKQIPELSLSGGTESITKVVFNFFILSNLW